MQILIEIEDEFGDAYTILARSNNSSRRQYIADLLRKAALNIPGLMEMVKKQRSGNIEVTIDASLAAADKEKINEKGDFKDHFETVKGYRFYYLDEDKGFIDGYGKGPKDALLDATGREWPTTEYYETFRPWPGYVPK